MFPKQTCLSLFHLLLFTISVEFSLKRTGLNTSFCSSKANRLRASNEVVKTESESSVNLSRAGLIFGRKDLPEFHFGTEVTISNLLVFQTTVVRSRNKKHEVTQGLSLFASDVAAKPNLVWMSRSARALIMLILACLSCCPWALSVPCQCQVCLFPSMPEVACASTPLASQNNPQESSSFSSTEISNSLLSFSPSTVVVTRWL